jgi:hypothetical protein
VAVREAIAVTAPTRAIDGFLLNVLHIRIDDTGASTPSNVTGPP